MTVYTLHRGEATIEIRADDVEFYDGGVVAFYEEPDGISLESRTSSNLLTAYKDWDSITTKNR